MRKCVRPHSVTHSVEVAQRMAERSNAKTTGATMTSGRAKWRELGYDSEYKKSGTKACTRYARSNFQRPHGANSRGIASLFGASTRKSLFGEPARRIRRSEEHTSE